MDYLKTNKFQSKYENVLFVSKVLYSLINRPINTEKLIRKYEKEIGMGLTEEYEKIAIFSLCFLHSVGLIEINKDKIERRFLN